LFLRRVVMNVLKGLLLIALLLSIAIVAGCQEQQARTSSGRTVALEPSVTGFWQATAR